MFFGHCGTSPQMRRLTTAPRAWTISHRRCSALSPFVARQRVGSLEPCKLLGNVHVASWFHGVRIGQGSHIKIDLRGVAVRLVANRRPAMPAVSARDAGRGRIGCWCRFGVTKGTLVDANERRDRAGCVAPATLAMAMQDLEGHAPVLELDIAAETSS